MGFEEYNPTVMDHFLNPRNTGTLADPSATAFVENPACGDLVKLTLRIEGDVIRDARAQTFGCAAAIAASSALTEILIGRDLASAATVTDADVVARLNGLPEAKVKCSLAAGEAVRSALQDYARRGRPA